MNQINDNQHEATDPLRLDRCPDCGYLFTGLPEEGLCPECEFAYTRDIIVLYGWARGPHRSGINMRLGWIEWSITRTFLVVLAMLVVGVESGSGMAMGVAGVLATGCVGYSGYRRWRVRREAPAPVQLRLFPQGFAQQNGIGPVNRLLAWRRRQVCIRKLQEGRYRIRSWRFLQWQIGSRLRSIDFEWQCDDATAARIEQRISDWCSH